MRFLAVDLSSVFRRMWEAAEGEEFGQARQRAMRAIMNAAEGFDRVVVARDAPSFRYTVYPEYKAGRTDPGEAFREQLRLVIQDLKEIGATVWASPSLSPPMPQYNGQNVYGEADDVLASFALWYQEMRLADDGVDRDAWELTILSGDRDLWALVDDSLKTEVRTLEGKQIKREQVLAPAPQGFGLAPEFVPEFKALAGDKSDGWAGFEGVGAVLAGKIISAGAGLVQPGDVGPSDPIFRLIVAGQPLPFTVPKPALAALAQGGLSHLKIGRAVAQLRPWLVAPKSDGERWDVMNFGPVLEEPRVPRRKVSPPAEPSQSTVAAAPPPASTALAVAEPKELARDSASLPFAPQINKMMRFAEQMHESGIFRMTLGSPAACLMVCEYARAFAIPAVILAQHTSVIKGRIGFGAQMLAAIVIRDRSTKAFRFTGNPNDPTVQRIKYHRVYPDGGEESGVYEFTIEMARKAGFLDGRHSEQWAKRPAVMLGWAATRECAKKFWPELTIGLPSHWEPQDEGDFPAEMTAELEEAA